MIVFFSFILAVENTAFVPLADFVIGEFPPLSGPVDLNAIRFFAFVFVGWVIAFNKVRQAF
jgi:hypothetical protein